MLSSAFRQVDDMQSDIIIMIIAMQCINSVVVSSGGWKATWWLIELGQDEIVERWEVSRLHCYVPSKN